MYFLSPARQIFTFTVADEKNLIALSDKGSRDGVKMSFEPIPWSAAPIIHAFDGVTSDSNGVEIFIKTIQFCTDLYECWNLCNSSEKKPTHGLLNAASVFIEENIRPRVIIEGFRRAGPTGGIEEPVTIYLSSYFETVMIWDILGTNNQGFARGTNNKNDGVRERWWSGFIVGP